jgi:hypothetical protein
MCGCSLAHAKFDQHRNHFFDAMLTPPKTQLQQQKKATAADHRIATKGGE